MNYAAHYQALITRAENRVLEGYGENHHVVPKCVDKASKRTVKLTPEEHFVAHQLLMKMYPDNPRLVFAITSMTMTSPSTLPRGNKFYGWLRRAHAVAMSRVRKGVPWTEEARENHGDQWNKGLKTGPLSVEQRALLSEIQLKSYAEHPERGANHSAAMKRHFDAIGRKPRSATRPSKKFVKGQEAWNKGKHWSPEVLAKIGKPRPAEGRRAVADAVVRREERRQQGIGYQMTKEQKTLMTQGMREAIAKQRAADALLSPELLLRTKIMRLQKKLADLQAKIDRESEVA